MFVSVLQHGNETTGWEAARRLLKRYRSGSLPRSLILLIANVEAARYGLRRLDHQPDFNRCWPGAPRSASPTQRALAELVDQLREVDLFLSIDIHNNSGRNPHYAAVNRLRPEWIFLACQFDRRAVYFRHPKGTQSDAFSNLCPALTLECGQARNLDAVPHCLAFLEKAIRWETLPSGFGELDLRGFDLFQTIARTTVAPEVDFGFGDPDSDISFLAEIEDLNFQRLAEGTVLGEVRRGQRGAIHALNSRGEDVTADFFKLDYGRLVVRRPFVPAMLSTDPRIVRQDCFCYVMEPLAIPQPREDGAGEMADEVASLRKLRAEK